MGNRLVARYAQPSRQAAARIGQEDQIIGMHNVHIGSASQYFAEMFPGGAGASEHAEQLVPVSFIDRGAQRIEVATKIVQGVQHRFAIGEEDVVPHHRVAAGDAGEIPETAGRITKYF